MRRGFFWALGAVALAAACGGSDDTTGGAGGSTTSTSSSGGAGGDTSSTGSVMPVPDCKGASPENPNQKVPVGVVTVRVEDANGKPLPDSEIDVQLCGSDLCLYGKSSDGNYSLTNGGNDLVDPALKYGSQTGTSYLFWGGALPMGPDHDYGTVTAVKLGPAGGKLEPGATVTSSGVSVTFAPEANIEQELLAPEEEFAAVVFKPTDGSFPALAASAQAFDLIVGLGPADVDICPPARLSFANSEGWAPKTAVEFWINGVKTYDHWAPYGTWTKVAEGVVSDDGKTVSTADGMGIPALAAYGIVKKP